MKTIKTSENLIKYLNKDISLGKKIGFVPTMGALHAGHLSLVKICKNTCDICVVSIFVNPTQFNASSDFETYPKTVEDDIQLLEKILCDVLFLPQLNDIYNTPPTDIYNFGSIASTMEGPLRPGHFNGVAQVVRRLFKAVRPQKAFFGEKDYQQLCVIRKLVKQLKLQIEIIGCPIIREKDGLAMSSRNKLLTLEFRKKAIILNQLLTYATTHYHIGIDKINQVVTKKTKQQGLELEYFTFADSRTLQPVNENDPPSEMRVFIAAFAGKVRLIDNMPIIV